MSIPDSRVVDLHTYEPRKLGHILFYYIIMTKFDYDIWLNKFHDLLRFIFESAKL